MLIVNFLALPSDDAQGGDDDVIGCKRDRKLSSRVVPMSLGNLVKHTPPQEKEHRLVLKDGRLQNDHIYCRIVRPLKVKTSTFTAAPCDSLLVWHATPEGKDLHIYCRSMRFLTCVSCDPEGKDLHIYCRAIRFLTSVSLDPLR